MGCDRDKTASSFAGPQAFQELIVSTLQEPIHSGFSAASTTADVIKGIDLTGKVAIVTGGYSGLGRETARVLLTAGAKVIVPARDVQRAKVRLRDIPDVDIRPMDLAEPASVSAFAESFLAERLPLHILVNSAGIMALPSLERNSEGHELQFATNHLGHFLLTARLWPALERANGARVVSVASMGHWFSPVVFDDIDFECRVYDPWAAYGQSKTANILFAIELDRRGKGSGVRAFALHPGGIAGTGLEKHVPVEQLQAAGILDEDGKPIIDPARGQKTVEQGAATQLWCAVSPQLDGMGGVYCEDVDISPIGEETSDGDFSIDAAGSSNGVRRYAIDPESAARLWTLSEQYVGLEGVAE
jgi:NAD(P)-dependent dehydrogenase (short-subunit alcohol dehydrogenase family)